MKLELEAYTPSEAEMVTEVKQATIRNWRRAGHLPRQEGHARYNFPDLLVQFAMGLLVSRGITPEAAKEFAGPAARAIFQSAVYSTKAFSDNVEAQAKEEVGKLNEDQLAPFKEQLGDQFEPEMLELVRSREIMINSAAELASISGIKHPYWLIIWADASLEFLYEEEDPDCTFFSNIQYDKPYVQGPVMMFCLGALAEMVVDRLPRPAFRLAGGS